MSKLQKDKQGQTQPGDNKMGPSHGEFVHTSRVDQPLLVVDSERLFSGRQEVAIRHDGQTYRLRITRNGKLILNK
jgi:hemin uptake protein HemP